MTAREQQALAAVLEEVRETTATLATDVASIKALLANGAPAPAVAANGRGPKWLDFVRFGGKPCAGGCGTIIPTGPGRAWYEPASAAHKARVFCEPCGSTRERAPVKP